jgi:hypothetical protein
MCLSAMNYSLVSEKMQKKDYLSSLCEGEGSCLEQKHNVTYV